MVIEYMKVKADKDVNEFVYKLVTISIVKA